MAFEVVPLETQGDCSLVWMRGRKFPGLLLQGDSVKILSETLQEAVEALEIGQIEDVNAALVDSRDRIKSWVAAYEEMMAVRQLPLPYRS